MLTLRNLPETDDSNLSTEKKRDRVTLSRWLSRDIARWTDALDSSDFLPSKFLHSDQAEIDQVGLSFSIFFLFFFFNFVCFIKDVR